MQILERSRHKQQGGALIATLAVGTVMLSTAAAYFNINLASLRTANAQLREAVMGNLSEAGLAVKAQTLWSAFKRAQNFTQLDANLSGVSALMPRLIQSGVFRGIGIYTVGVVGYSNPDTYTRYVTIRAVGWIDRNRNGALDPAEPRRTIDQTIALQLSRSEVFDYTYFVNNYGWMYGFDGERLIANGDMRANGNFEFRYGLPTINGSIYACRNNKLIPMARGIINIAPRQWSNNLYFARQNRYMRPAYNPLRHGAFGSDTFKQWRDLVYNAEGSMQENRPFGAVLADSRGTRKFNDVVIDRQPTEESLLPNLNNLAYYLNLSRQWRNQKRFFRDGTRNPNYNQPAYVEVWNPARRRYQRVSTNGVINGSVALIGYRNYPIKIHGPVTVTQDVVIRGYVQGQGTLYAGRNVHVVGDIIYKSPPDFRGSDLNQIENESEKRDFLALAARGSVMMGNTRQFRRPYPLDYMTPPFTKPRYDEDGNLIPAFNALERDYTRRYRYQSAYGDVAQRTIERLCLNIDIDQNRRITRNEKGISRVDAILFSNFVGGGNIGTAGYGFTLNGSIISKDEAMVLWSLPMIFNYDWRVKERSITQTPLIDLNLPRVAAVTRLAWQTR